jgi:hypothetical protein
LKGGVSFERETNSLEQVNKRLKFIKGKSSKTLAANPESSRRAKQLNLFSVKPVVATIN